MFTSQRSGGIINDRNNQGLRTFTRQQNDLISVIVPIYKVEQYLHKCVELISNQTYKNLEIILVDGGSTDSSYKICKKY